MHNSVHKMNPIWATSTSSKLWIQIFLSHKEIHIVALCEAISILSRTFYNWEIMILMTLKLCLTFPYCNYEISCESYTLIIIYWICYKPLSDNLPVSLWNKSENHLFIFSKASLTFLCVSVFCYFLHSPIFCLKSPLFHFPLSLLSSCPFSAALHGALRKWDIATHLRLFSYWFVRPLQPLTSTHPTSP